MYAINRFQHRLISVLAISCLWAMPTLADTGDNLGDTEAGVLKRAQVFKADALEASEAFQRRTTEALFEDYTALARKLERNRRLLESKSNGQPGTLATMDSFNIDELLSRYSEPMNQARRPSEYTNSFLVFVSSSLPKPTLVALASQAKAAGGTLIMRGMVNNNFKETVLFIKALTEQGGTGAKIDPTLFDLFNIEQVPAFVVVSGAITSCSDTDCVRATPKHDTIKGNITARYALEQIADRGTDARDIAKTHLRFLGPDYEG
ncbi:MAG: type-F conjugative transfer system pilin assembly protein TrbC [Gammaproteobacteria bacterium]|nr:type-F conjugative transfer system pilin assembly protein TrbC [Gammaproteobacteria bacterium]